MLLVERVSFRLEPVPPFRLDLAVWALKRRPHYVVDRWDGKTYRRVLAMGGQPVEAAVTQDGPLQKPHLHVEVRGDRCVPGTREKVTRALELLLGIRVDLSNFYAHAGQENRLHLFAARFMGFKPPRFLSIFEALLNAICCQQLTLTLGLRFLGGLTEIFGASYQDGNAQWRAFPGPEDLRGADPQKLRALGLSGNKVTSLLEAAEVCAAGALQEESLSPLADDALRARLCQLRGVGRWTAEYVMLRGFGRLNIFPFSDSGALNSLRRWLKLNGKLDQKTVEGLLRRWSPYAGLVYFHLLLDGVVKAGFLEPPGHI